MTKTVPIMAKNAAKEIWKKEICDPKTWRDNASKLFGAALMIYDLAESECPGIFQNYDLAKSHRDENSILGLVASYFIQSGFGIENALKALCVQADISENKPILDGKDKLAKRYRTHDLLDLAERCHFDVSEVQKDLLEDRTSYIKWGKYGYALDFEEHLSSQGPKYDDRTAAKELMAALETRYQSQIES